MRSSNKVTFKVILVSSENQQFKIFSVPEDTPFIAFMRFVFEQFRVPHENSAIISSNGVEIDPKNTASQIYLKHGSELHIIKGKSS